MLIRKGVSNEVAYTIVESISSIYTKVHKLLMQLDNVSFKNYKEINKKWGVIVEKRNKVAYGEIADIQEQDARDCFETVVRGIFYIYLSSSL